MPISAELKAALRSFSHLEQQVVQVSSHVDTSNATTLVRLRRDLVHEFAALSHALEHDHHLRSNPEKFTEATRLLSAFRTQNSVNQADWPVILVRDNPSGYRASVGTVAGRSHAFWHWVEKELRFRR